MSLYLFDDAVARAFDPFGLTRPAGELLYGCILLRERAERVLGRTCLGHVVGDGLQGFSEAGAPPTLSADGLPDDRDRVLLSSRAVLELSRSGTLSEGRKDAARNPLEADGGAEREHLLTVGGELVGWHLPAGAPNPELEALLEPASSADGGRPSIELPGELLRHPWDLITGNPERVRHDVPTLYPHSSAFLPPEAEQIGDDFPVSTGRDVELEPGVVLDTRKGPIRLEAGVRIRSHTRLEGPLYVGRDSTILGGNVTASSIGPRCKIRGEVEESVVLGFSNKAHDGFLGHAYLGRWVNLGAMTTNSDLKNNYGDIRVRIRDEEMDTGLMKLGCLLGDHVKTGIGMLFNTGTIVGTGANLFGTAMPPRYVPPFSWGSGHELGEYRIDAFLATAQTVMGRREQELDDSQREMLRKAWERTRDERTGS